MSYDMQKCHLKFSIGLLEGINVSVLISLCFFCISLCSGSDGEVASVFGGGGVSAFRGYWIEPFAK